MKTFKIEVRFPLIFYESRSDIRFLHSITIQFPFGKKVTPPYPPSSSSYEVHQNIISVMKLLIMRQLPLLVRNAYENGKRHRFI